MSKLEQLREMTVVVADTGDIEAIRRYAPVDATTNPSLLLKTAEDPTYGTLLDQAIGDAPKAGSAAATTTAVADQFAVLVGKEILKLVPGVVSTEVDARLSFDTSASVAKAEQLIDLYASAGIAKERILIKIASTWEGIEAAKILEQQGIRCNLTLLFSDIQALAAARAGAFLISPFVGRILDWHKTQNPEQSFDATNDPGVASVRNIYRMYKTRGFETVVMGASFRNAGQVEALAGCDRLTISPGLLDQLQEDDGTLARQLDPSDIEDAPNCTFDGEADFRLQLNSDAMATEKLAQGIRAFCADQVKLETLIAARI
ncbi:MAG: transaldolase [Pseudomonadota bacterium]